MELPHETIEKKARHFIRWNPTIEMRLAQLNEMANFAGHFNPEWKTENMIVKATDLFAALEKEGAQYLVMGGFAAIIYGVPRLTIDVDLFIEGSDENISQVIDALIALGSEQAKVFKSLNSTIVTFIEFDDLPVKTDIMVKVPGVKWDNAWANRTQQIYQDQPFTSISREDLITAKRAAGRPQDLEDVRALEIAADKK
ncbi:MAG: DUF6036 family nucleotidyltransferase [Chloroflexota bacterium]